MLCIINTHKHNRRKKAEDFLFMNLKSIDLVTCCCAMACASDYLDLCFASICVLLAELLFKLLYAAQ